MSPRRAFTLIELVVVVLITSILAASAAPKVRNALNHSRVTAACRRIKADLMWARQTAIATSAPQTVQFTPGTGAYAAMGLANVDRPSHTYGMDLAQSPFACTIASAVLGGDAAVVFNHWGMPDSGGVITVSLSGVTGTVTIDANTGLANIP